MENMYRAMYSILILVFICGCYAGKLRIVDGDIVKSIEEYPFMASIGSFSDNICGGTILSKRYVLTAAHCIYLNDEEPLPPRFASVRVGSLSKSSGGKIYQVEEIKLNPFWRKFEKIAYSSYGDLALIKLKEDIEYNEKVQPVTLPAGKDYSVPDGSTVTVVGYGLTEYATEEMLKDESYEKNDVLRSTKMQVYSNQKCRKDWKEYMNTLEREVDRKSIAVNVRNICLKGERDFCNGDSGGPAIDENNVQVGVISMSNNCSQTEILLPSTVTDVRKWLWWINQELSKKI